MEQYKCQVLLGQILRTALFFKMESLTMVHITVVELYMSRRQQYPLEIADFRVIKPAVEEQSMLSPHKSQLMDQHLITTEHIIMEEEYILPRQPL